MKKPYINKQTAATKNRKEHIVTSKTELLIFLIEQYPDQSRKKIKSYLEHKQVRVDGRITSQFDHPLEKGQKIIIEKTGSTLKHSSINLNILFEDDYLVIIDKPAGLLAVPTDTEKEDTALWILSEHVRLNSPDSRVYTVHRLDKGTSGVMMFCKNTALREKLQDNWDSFIKERKYVALVEGKVEKESDTITSWLKENKALKMYSTQNPLDALKAITHYRVKKLGKKYSLLDIILETGRKNQIRVHMEDIGHPVCGDLKYSAKSDPIKRLGLHAAVLSFIHPVTSEEMRFESPVPKPFWRLCR